MFTISTRAANAINLGGGSEVHAKAETMSMQIKKIRLVQYFNYFASHLISLR